MNWRSWTHHAEVGFLTPAVACFMGAHLIAGIVTGGIYWRLLVLNVVMFVVGWGVRSIIAAMTEPMYKVSALDEINDERLRELLRNADPYAADDERSRRYKDGAR